MPALRCDFVNFDDPQYVLENLPVLAGLSPEGTRWAFTTFSNSNWHPLTWLSLQLDVSLWGVGRPWGFHLTNVLLHAANTALLFLALRALTGAFWRCIAVALLFAVHPLRVESVAWVTERKDVLSALFGFLALWAYAAYARRPAVRRYLLVTVLFAVSLLAKPMLVTLPCLLLVLDWWPLKRAVALRDWGRLVAEKLPLLALVAASAAVTVKAQAGEGAVAGLAQFPLGVRLGNAAVGYVAYLTMTVWPVGLAVYYPHPGELPVWQTAGAALLLAALTAGAVALRGRAPYLLAGWLWFLGTLVPVIGLVQAGAQAYADRYTYLPQVGLLLAVCWGAADLARARPRPALAAGALVGLALAGLTWFQLGVWRDSVSLWEHDLRVARPSAMAWLNLGAALAKQGRDGEADCYRRAIRAEPGSVQAHINLGELLSRQGDDARAVQLLEQACALSPKYAPARATLGNALFRQNRLSEAARRHREAIELDPNLIKARYDLGLVETVRGNFAGAEECYRALLRIEPHSAEAAAGLGFALARQGKVEEGLSHLRAALARDPRYARGHFFLAEILEARGDLGGAARHLEQAVKLEPGSALFRAAQARVRAALRRPGPQAGSPAGALP